GDLLLEGADPLNPAADPDLWERVVRKLNQRQMPPLGEARPDDPTFERVVAQLVPPLDRAAAEHPNPGRTDTLRRLNRTEYQNAIRDLLALEINATSMLPPDEASPGFDNVTVGEVSPPLLGRYIAAAEQISRCAAGGTALSGG